MKKNILRNTISFLILCIIALSIILFIYLYSKDVKKDVEFVSIKSEADFKKVIQGKENNEVLKRILTLPISLLFNNYMYSGATSYENNFIDRGFNTKGVDQTNSLLSPVAGNSEASSSKTSVTESNSSSDYSKTNIQVENVDEADVIKTDGEYIYSISGSSVIVSKTDKSGKVEILSTINTAYTPEEFLIKDNKLIVITYLDTSNGNIANTMIEIYDTTNKEKVNLIKKIKVDNRYYTSRMIDNKIYILTTGYIQNNYLDYSTTEYTPSYSIDGIETKMPYNKIKYMKNNHDSNKYISIITTIDINDLTKEPEFNGYLMPIENAYISENNIYIAFDKYEYSKNDDTLRNIKSLFSLGGIPGFIKYVSNYYEDDNGYQNYTNIVKFGFTSTGIEYLASGKESGTTVNQFSMDEYMGSLRVTLSEGTNKSKLVVFSNEMKRIGIVDNIAPGEKIYATRFIKDRAYVVTYKTMDPLFVIDLREPTNPKILGELKIPGYSTYLHPYDENHIIGIGNATEEKIIKDADGKIISKRAFITGMKMAIFDVTDVKNPKEKFSQKIGDRSTYSTILKNHKALLFSKEKELLAIPINNYKEAIEVNSTSNAQVNEAINITENIKTTPIKSGYIVYNINLKDGFKEKGIITHDNLKTKYDYYWYGSNDIVRGLYIGDNLYTVSESYIKSHSLDKLEEKSSIEIGR